MADHHLFVGLLAAEGEDVSAVGDELCMAVICTWGSMLRSCGFEYSEGSDVGAAGTIIDFELDSGLAVALVKGMLLDIADNDGRIARLEVLRPEELSLTGHWAAD